VLEIRDDRSGGLAVVVNGQLVRRLAVEHPSVAETPAACRLDGAEFRELFDSSPDALRALRDFLASHAEPPWEHTATLLADGLIDVDFIARPRRARL
jgi:hypothetical protein